MKYIVLFFYFTFSGVLIAQENIQQPVDSVICWKSSDRLSWNDFQSTVKPKVYAKAMTSYKIDIFPVEVMVDEQDRIQDFEKLTVKAQFYKNHSWTSTQNGFLLEHEQLHFDIAELYARKIRQEFAELKSINEARFSIFWDSYSLLWQECRKLQQQYDIETEHGQDLKLNQAWEQRIIRDLMAIEEFE